MLIVRRAVCAATRVGATIACMPIHLCGRQHTRVCGHIYEPPNTCVSVRVHRRVSVCDHVRSPRLYYQAPAHACASEHMSVPACAYTHVCTNPCVCVCVCQNHRLHNLRRKLLAFWIQRLNQSGNLDLGFQSYVFEQAASKSGTRGLYTTHILFNFTPS